jgi:hypothetical protein
MLTPDILIRSSALGYRNDKKQPQPEPPPGIIEALINNFKDHIIEYRSNF